MEENKEREKKCPLCGALLEGVSASASGDYRCGRCGSTGRYEGENLVAIFIPNYFARLAELEKRHRELVDEIYLEGLKGEARDRDYIQRMNLERQSVLAEYSMLSYFREFVEKW